jgi:hypothetical protein
MNASKDITRKENYRLISFMSTTIFEKYQQIKFNTFKASFTITELDLSQDARVFQCHICISINLMYNVIIMKDKKCGHLNAKIAFIKLNVNDKNS